jgi:parallel beta-helix repeat protein
MDLPNTFSGNSVFIEGSRDHWVSGNIIKGNRIINAKESGLLLNYCKNITVKDNIISCFEENKPKAIFEKVEDIATDVELPDESGQYILTDGATEIVIRHISEVYNGLIRIKENQKIKADITFAPFKAETKTAHKVKLSLGSFSTQFINNASEQNYAKASELIRETDLACLSDNTKWQIAIEEINKL